MEKNRLFIVLFSFLISYSFNFEQFIFTIKKFHLSYFSCLQTYGTYTFFIDGEFNGSPSESDFLLIDLDNPVGAKAECKPFARFDYFECEIDICLYNLTSLDILFSLNAPISEKYKVENWEEVISKIPGITNLIDENITCVPYIQNTFIPSSIESKGCSGNKNIFNIKGDWENGGSIPSNDFDFKIEINNKEKDIANCNFSIFNVKEFNCEFEGEGKINFEEKYFKGYFANYMMNKTNIFKDVKKCEENNKEDKENIDYLANLGIVNMIILMIFILF